MAFGIVVVGGNAPEFFCSFVHRVLKDRGKAIQ